MKFLNKTFLIALAALSSLSIYAQDETAEVTPSPTFSVAGSVDAYFRGTEYAPDTSFADLNGFALGMANIIVSYEGEKSGFVADLVFGPRGNDAVFGSTVGSTPIVNQLYVYYNVSDSFTLTMGNFNTFLGYEVISPAANFNYSTSYMFSNGPFSHTGIKADFGLSDDVSLMTAILNETDETEAQPASGDYVFGAQLGLYGQYINFISGGAAGVSQIDFTGGFDISDNFFLGLNATSYEDDESEWSGVALYPQYTLSDSFAIGLRGESFDVKDANTFTSFTITGSYTSGNMIIKPEIRIDSADENVSTWSANGTDSISSFVLAAIYSF
jgi:hypothetical protein